jgi:hypothetical protein
VKKTGAVLDPILRSLGLESGVRLARIRNDWQKIFDDQVTSQLHPASLSGSELLLNVSSPIWMQQFSFHKGQILKKLNSYGVQSIRFRLGKIPPRIQESKPPKTVELTPENRIFVSEILADVNDEKLKEAVKKAIEKSLRSVNTKPTL